MILAIINNKIGIEKTMGVYLPLSLLSFFFVAFFSSDKLIGAISSKGDSYGYA